MIRIKWVRSGIGFTYRQKGIVHSLGLRRLNQVVVREDTPQNRGIVAAVPHLLKIIPDAPIQAWRAVPEHSVQAPASGPSPSEVPVRDPERVELPTASAAVEPTAESAKSPAAGKEATAEEIAAKVEESDSDDKSTAQEGSQQSKATEN